MKVRSLILVSTMSLFATMAFAQKGELFGNYSYMQFNPTINGLNSRALNGAGGGAQWNIKPMIGIKAEFQGYMSTETSVSVTSPIPGPNGGIIPVGTYKSNATMFTYLFGPVVQLPGKRFSRTRKAVLHADLEGADCFGLKLRRGSAAAHEIASQQSLRRL